jgi:hypothetical protein
MIGGREGEWEERSWRGVCVERKGRPRLSPSIGASVHPPTYMRRAQALGVGLWEAVLAAQAARSARSAGVQHQ